MSEVELREALRCHYYEQVEHTSDGHYLWVGPYDESGCAVLRCHSKTYQARRVGYFLHHGEWPTERVKLKARCGVDACVRGDHTFVQGQLPKAGEVLGYCLRGHPRTKQNVNPKSGECRLCRAVYRERRREMRHTQMLP